MPALMRLRYTDPTPHPPSVFAMKRTAPWRATAVAAVTLGSHTASGWLAMGGSAFELSSSSFRTTTAVRKGLASSTSSAWTSSSASRRAGGSSRSSSGGGAPDGIRMQVWSNPQAVQDYKDLLDGNAPEDTIDQPSVIIGKGKLGTALAGMGMGEDTMLGRGEAIPDTLPFSTGKGDDGGDGTGVLQNFPIYVCVPEEEVAAVIDSCPEDKREDLVFMSSGCLEPLLKSRGCCRGEQTQATLFFRVDKVIMERQKKRESCGDNVNYVLARTVRSCLRYQASVALGAKGAGNQCKRGACFAQAIGMFSGVGMEGIPREVVLALMRY